MIEPAPNIATRYREMEACVWRPDRGSLFPMTFPPAEAPALATRYGTRRAGF